MVSIILVFFFHSISSKREKLHFIDSFGFWILWLPESFFFMEIPLVKFFMWNFCAKMLHLVHIPFILSRVNEFQKHLKWLFVFGLK